MKKRIEVDKKTSQQLNNNALYSQKIFSLFLRKLKEPTAFWRCFHLRPTSEGVTIVSTLPYAPMRGVSVKLANLEGKLDIISENFNKIVSINEKQAKQQLCNLGFQERSLVDKTLEEDIQASFIRGMIDKEFAYDDIQFIASELNLEDANRFDVVGIKKDCIYIFELKKERTTAVFQQVSKYIDHFNQYRNEFFALLQNYPNLSLPITQIREIKGISVMKYAGNSPLTKWEPLINQHQIDVWFYKESISFHKLATTELYSKMT